MRTLLSIIFISYSLYSYSAGTDSGGSSSSSSGPSTSSGGSNSNSISSEFRNSSAGTIDVNIEFHRAKKYIYKKQFEKGLKLLKKIEDEPPFGYSKSDLYNYMGFASRKQKNPDYINAEKYYLQALSLNADHVGALEYLGELYYETKRKDKAISMLNKLGMVAGRDSPEYKELYKLLN